MGRGEERSPGVCEGKRGKVRNNDGMWLRGRSDSLGFARSCGVGERMRFDHVCARRVCARVHRWRRTGRGSSVATAACGWEEFGSVGPWSAIYIKGKYKSQTANRREEQKN
uniref:Uncharacterized protein n=1 Tax=Oryza rufipogon TaxID=4529 RepID=A0A0E0PR80_ORYRU